MAERSTRDVPRQRPVALAVALMVGPVALSALFLGIGLFGSLAWVYLSLLFGLLWLPCLIVGVVLLLRRPSDTPRWRFNPPPGWPEPPPGWAPPPGWQPDPAWPAPPPNWQLWVPVGGGTVAAGPASDPRV